MSIRFRRSPGVQVRRFEQQAWPLLPVVLRTAQFLTRDTQAAEDLAQDTMLKALKSLESFRDGTNMKAWLLTILRRTHIDELRRRGVRPKPTSLASVPDPAAPESTARDDAWHHPEELMERFDDEDVIDALRALPDELRWTLLLVDVEQVPMAEAAESLDIALGTVKSRCHRGRRQLRDALHERALQRGWTRNESEGKS